MTGFVPVMWAVWGLFVLLTAALKIYTGRLSRDEDDQLILDDAFDHLKTEQAAIVARVNKVQPLTNASMWVAAAATVFVIGYYVWDILTQFK
jgi:hypothetical protein